MCPYNYIVALRIFHPEMDPAVITESLGMKPSRSWKVGEVRTSISGELLGGHNAESFWCTTLEESADSDLGAFLIRATERLKLHRQFFRKVRSTGGRLDLYVSLYPGGCIFGVTFTSDLMHALGLLGVDLGLDTLYDNDNGPAA